METISCKQCGNGMKQTTKAGHNMALQVVAILLVLVGIALLFVFPIGTLAGALIIGASLRLGYKKRKVWLCGKCGYFFERA
jgi:uncharacterized membrane protein YczE